MIEDDIPQHRGGLQYQPIYYSKQMEVIKRNQNTEQIWKPVAWEPTEISDDSCLDFLIFKR